MPSHGPQLFIDYFLVHVWLIVTEMVIYSLVAGSKSKSDVAGLALIPQLKESVSVTAMVWIVLPPVADSIRGTAAG